jgi:hypothetical protein
MNSKGLDANFSKPLSNDFNRLGGKWANRRYRVGKDNTQKIERKPINLRTRIKRLVRRTICFTKMEHMHELVIGLFINRYEFGRSI